MYFFLKPLYCELSLCNYSVVIAFWFQLTRSYSSLCRSSSKGVGRFHMDTSITKQPASLKYLSTLNNANLMMKQEGRYYLQCCELKGLMRRIYEMVYTTPTNMANYLQPFECNYFSFYLVDKHTILGTVSDEYVDHLFDVLRESEFTKMYFHFVYKYIMYELDRWNYIVPIIKIPITPHWWEYLLDNGVVYKLYLCKNLHDISLLLLSGDVEENPGPTYKELCAKKFKHKQISRNIYEIKQHQTMIRELRKKEEEFDLKQVIKAEIQIGFLSAGMALGSSYLGFKTNNVLNNAQNIVDNMSSQISTVLESFQGIMKTIENKFVKTIDLITLVSDFVFSIMQVSYAKSSKRLQSFGLEMFRLLLRHGFPTEICQKLIVFIGEYVIHYAKKIMPVSEKVEMQIDAIFSGDTVELNTDIKGEALDITQYLTPTYLVMGLFGILSLLFTSVLPSKTQCEDVINRLGLLGRSSRGIKDLASTAHDSFAVMIDYFKINVLNLRPTEEIENFVSGIDRWFDEVREFLNRNGEIKKSDKILTDPKIIVEVENLYKRGMDFSREIADKKLQRELQLPFQIHMKYLTDILKLVDTSGAFGTRPRTQPVVIWLFGESGVGKSGMSWPLAVDLNNLFVQNKEEAKEFSKNIYMRNVEQEFWDNYQGQNVVVYDDFGQRVDSSSNPNEEFMELIRTANIAPYPLHMAHLEDKRKTRFVSKVVLMTSNIFEHVCNSLTFPDAFRRRVDLCAKVRNKLEFTKPGYSKSAGGMVNRLDPDKVRSIEGKIISTDVYLIDLINPESGETIQEGLNYEEFLDLAIKKTNKNFKSSIEMNTFLEEYAEKRFTEMQINIDEFKELEDNTEEYLRSKIQEGSLYTRTGRKVVDYLDEYCQVVLDCTEDDSYMECVDVNYRISETWKQNYWLKKNKFVEKFKYFKNMALSSITMWKEEMIKMCKEHPFVILGSLLLAVSSIFAACKFYNYIFGRPGSYSFTKKQRYVLDNITYEAYNNQIVNDCTALTTSQILKHFIVISANNFPILIDKFDNLLHEYLKGLEIPYTVYLINGVINHHGKKIQIEASVSGDNVTINAKKVQVEASVSGDNVTIAGKKVDMECDRSLISLMYYNGFRSMTDVEKKRFVKTSQDNTLSLSKLHHEVLDGCSCPKVKIDSEASVSGDNITLKANRVSMESNVLVDMQMWQDQVAQNLISNRIFTNMYKISKKIGDDLLPLLHGLFVKGHCMLIPNHLIGFVQQDEIINITNIFGVTFDVPWKEIKQIPIKTRSGQCKEAALLVFPKFVNSHCDLVKHFSDNISLQSYKRANVCLPVMRYSTKVNNFMMSILGNTECDTRDKPLILSDAKLGDYILREGLEYNLNTTKGDCGAPIIINETKVLRKIAGIHVAGGLGGKAYAESITQKDLERALTSVPTEMQLSLDYDSVTRIIPYEIDLNTEYSSLDMKGDLPALGFNPIGRIEKMYEANKTEIQKSLIYGKVSDITTKPCILYDSNTNMKHLNLKKCTTRVPYISENDMEEAYLLVRNLWLKNRRRELARVLSYEEAIIGSDDSEYMGPINRSSSPGFPWIKFKKSGKKGKTTWFGDDDYIINEEVKQIVEQRLENAREGIRTPTIWVDTLKDERRPIEKVEAKKTRVFANGPMDFNIAFRMYFLGFVAHLMENRIINEVSLGTNVYSTDWKKHAIKLTSKGEKVIAGDFSTFDGTLNSNMMVKFVELANEFYNDSEENQLIRKVLFSEIYNSVHACDGLVYMMDHSQPSGNPVTTPLNCFINSLGIRMCFKKIVEGSKYTLKDFSKHVSMVSFGDDNLINFTDEISQLFRMSSLTKAFAAFGYIYTDDTKDLKGNAPEWKNLEEVTYLKRMFRFDEEKQRWESPLLLTTILETPNWCKQTLDIQEGTKINCENSIMELSQHPKEVFDKWSRIIYQAYYNETGDTLDISTYKGYSDQRYLDYYL